MIDNIIQLIKQNKNIFITGSAGTGKTYTIKKIVEYFNDNDISYGLTATTGIAASLIYGHTLHSFLGIGIGKKTVKALYFIVRRYNRNVFNTIRNLKYLIIDEVSMLDLELFEKINDFLMMIRENYYHFGGIKLILSGDFCQLPPVKGKFCFLSTLWNIVIDNVIYLKKNHRQGNDKLFFKMLQLCRLGSLPDKYHNILNKHVGKDISRNDIKPTILYACNKDVDYINDTELTKLLDKGEKNKTYYTTVISDDIIPQRIQDSIVSHRNIKKRIELVEKAQVMLLINLDVEKGLVNGARGVIREICDDGIIVQFMTNDVIKIKYYTTPFKDDIKVNDKYIKFQLKFMPLKLAYAITIHKSQGLTLDCAKISLDYNIFEYAQAYVALSRVKDMSSLAFTNYNKNLFDAHPDAVKFYRELLKK